MDPIDHFTACPCPNEREKQAVRALEAVCNSADGTQFETFLSNQFNVDPHMDAFFFAWSGQELAAVASLYADEEDETELTALVHPQWRRKGVFRALLSRALAALAPGGTEKLTFKTDAAFPAGQTLAERWGGVLRSREYLMVAGSHAIDTENLGIPGLEVSLAKRQELAALTDIEQEAFGGSRAEAQRYVEGTFGQSDQVLLAARWNGVPVGLASVDLAGRWAYLYGVCVARSYRGQGVGTALLRGALAAMPAISAKRPALSVEAENTVALRLYRRAGFELLGCQMYFTVPCAELRALLQ